MNRKSLLVKNLPDGIKNNVDFLRNFGITAVKPFGRRRVILRFLDEITARNALFQLHQMEIDQQVISAEYLGKRKVEDVPEIRVEAKGVSEEEKPKISDFVKSLYATSSRHGFDQPPPPHLKYAYPKINRCILDSISIVLLTNSKFYTQVLHLMNRMNLEPPFLPRSENFEPPGDPCDVATQTEDDNLKSFTKRLLGSDESELESEEESSEKAVIAKRAKRKLENEEQIKKKARKILHSTLNVKLLPSTSHGPSEDLGAVFEQDKPLVEQKIALNVSTLKLPEKSETEEKSETAQLEESTLSKFISSDDLKSNRIPLDQLKELPIFKNYKKGERTNKLYIKNLSKDVTEEDLRGLYGRFCSGGGDPDTNLDIRLMQHGKMKGQAFVTFVTAKESELERIEEALMETNGFILKNKPIIVCYGKK